MPLTDHLHRKSDPIRAFLDERLVDFRPARAGWHSAQSGGILVAGDASWSLIGWAIDYRIRMMLSQVWIHNSAAWIPFQSTIRSVARELNTMQTNHKGPLGHLSQDEETHLLQICYVMAMYESVARGSSAVWSNSPLKSLKVGAGWRAHLNRVSSWDIGILQNLVVPALELFAPLADQRIVVGPVFSDGEFVGGADGDLIINDNLIEVKCETPGFSGSAVRQVITYALLDAKGEYNLEKCSIYLARYGSLATWNLDEIIHEISLGRYRYADL
jgi:hypothetical protein